MLYLSFYSINALNPDLGMDAIKKYIITSTQTEGHATAIIFNPSHPAFMPDCSWVVEQIEALLKQKLKLFKTTNFDDCSTAINHYLIKDHDPLLISYPVHQSAAHPRIPFDHHLQVLSILKILLESSDVDEKPPGNTVVTYYPNKQINQDFPATLKEHFYQYALKHKKTHILSLCEQVTLNSHYLPSCENQNKAGDYLQNHPSVSYILRPSTKTRDNAELVFALSSYISALKKCIHIRFLIESSKLYKEEGYGNIVQEIDLTHDDLETVMNKSLEHAIRFEIEKSQKIHPAIKSGISLSGLADTKEKKRTQLTFDMSTASSPESLYTRSPSLAHLKTLSFLKNSIPRDQQPVDPALEKKGANQLIAPTFRMTEI